MKIAISVLSVLAIVVIIAVAGLVIKRQTDAAFARAGVQAYCREYGLDCAPVMANLNQDTALWCASQYDWSQYRMLFFDCLEQYGVVPAS